MSREMDRFCERWFTPKGLDEMVQEQRSTHAKCEDSVEETIMFKFEYSKFASLLNASVMVEVTRAQLLNVITEAQWKLEELENG